MSEQTLVLRWLLRLLLVLRTDVRCWCPTLLPLLLRAATRILLRLETCWSLGPRFISSWGLDRIQPPLRGLSREATSQSMAQAMGPRSFAPPGQPRQRFPRPDVHSLRVPTMRALFRSTRVQAETYRGRTTI